MIQRFGVSIDESLLKEFDEYIRKKGYLTRSEAIRDLIRNALIENKVEENAEIFGTIALIYNHEEKESAQKITNIQHHYLKEIRAVVHVHIDKKNCLEVIIVHGNAKLLQELANKFVSLKGVKNVKFQYTAVES